MKRLKLLFINIKKNTASFFTLFVVFSAVLMLLNYSVSQYMYINRSCGMFEKGGFDNGFHFINITPYDDSSVKGLKKDINIVEKYEFVQKVLYKISTAVIIGDDVFQLELCDEEVYSKMYNPLLSGQWKAKDSENLCAVVGGVLPRDIALNDIVLLKSANPNNDYAINVKISGVMRYPPMIFNTGSYSNIITADKFFVDLKTLYLPKNEETLNIIEGYNQSPNHLVTNGIIMFADDVTAEQKARVKDLISPNAMVTETDVILKNSKAYVDESLRKALPLPLFMLVVTTLSYISIAVLNIYKNKANYTIYHITGCGKRTLTAFSIAQVSLSLIFSTFFVSMSILALAVLAAKGEYALPGLVFSWQNIILSCTVSAVIFAIIAIISTLMLRKFSPVEQLRMVKE